jgi:hypothetical protein
MIITFTLGRESVATCREDDEQFDSSKPSIFLCNAKNSVLVLVETTFLLYKEKSLMLYMVAKTNKCT